MSATLQAAVAPETGTGRPWLLLGTCALGMFVGNLVAIPMTVTVPTIAEAFGVDITIAQWMMTAHFIALAAAMLPVGSLGDKLGRARIFSAGFVVLLIGLALTPLAASIEVLIALRALQGIGAGMVMVTAPALCTASLPPAERGRALGLVFMGGWLSNTIGQPLFGVMVQSTTWYSGFLCVLPLAALALLLALRLPRNEERTNGAPFDAVGALLLIAGFGTVVFAAGHGQEERWEVVHTITHVGPLMLFALSVMVMYYFHARRTDHPLLPLDLLRNVTLTTAAVTNMLAHMTMLMISFLMPFYLQNVLHHTPLETAFFLVPQSIALNVMSVPSGWLYDRYGSRLPCAVALFLGVLMLVSYGGLSESSGMVDVVARLILAGIVLGLFVTPNVSAILGAVPRQHYSLAAGMEQTSRNLGHAIGVVISSGVAAFYIPLQAAGQSVAPSTYVSVVHGASLIGSILLAGGIVLVLVRKEGGRSGRATPTAQPQPAGSRV